MPPLNMRPNPYPSTCVCHGKLWQIHTLCLMPYSRCPLRSRDAPSHLLPALQSAPSARTPSTNCGHKLDGPPLSTLHTPHSTSRDSFQDFSFLGLSVIDFISYCFPGPPPAALLLSDDDYKITYLASINFGIGCCYYFLM